MFGSNYEGWLDKVDHLVIEIHSDEDMAIVLAAVANYDFRITQCDELVVCSRRLPTPE